MSDIRLPSERHFRYHRRQWQLYLLFCTVMAIGTVAAVLLGENPSEFVLVPAAAVFILMLGLYLGVRVRDAKKYEEELRRIKKDEWLASSRNNSLRDAALVMIFSQVPLMFFMAYTPPEPSVVGMGVLTTALGCGAYAGGYLFRTRANADE